MTETLEKEIINRVKRIKCQQADCRSGHQETLEVAVIGNDPLKRKGVMCTSCFIDQDLIGNLGNVELHAVAIQKFLKVLTENYSLYAQEKAKEDWPPTLVGSQKDQIHNKVSELNSIVFKGVMEIMKYLEDGIIESVDRAKIINHNVNLEKILDLITEENDKEQDRIEVTNEIQNVVIELMNDHGQYRLSSEDRIKKENESIILGYQKKVQKSREAIMRLVEIHKKCLKHLIE